MNPKLRYMNQLVVEKKLTYGRTMTKDEYHAAVVEAAAMWDSLPDDVKEMHRASYDRWLKGDEARGSASKCDSATKVRKYRQHWGGGRLESMLTPQDFTIGNKFMGGRRVAVSWMHQSFRRFLCRGPRESA